MAKNSYAVKRGKTQRWSVNYQALYRNRCFYCGIKLPPNKLICAKCAAKIKNAVKI